MGDINIIKIKISELFEKNPYIHISVKTTHPKIEIYDSPAEIIGVYPNMFRICESDFGACRCHSIKYTDILIGQVKISELS